MPLRPFNLSSIQHYCIVYKLPQLCLKPPPDVYLSGVEKLRKSQIRMVSSCELETIWNSSNCNLHKQTKYNSSNNNNNNNIMEKFFEFTNKHVKESIKYKIMKKARNNERKYTLAFVTFSKWRNKFSCAQTVLSKNARLYLKTLPECSTRVLVHKVPVGVRGSRAACS